MAHIRLFGPARDAAGRRADEIDGHSVSEVLAIATARYGPTFGALLSTSQVWVNGESAQLDTVLADHDEVAVIPPVSGG